ncbi:energy-coupling factor transport system permease protein [Bacillus mesophilus]|uniref:Energy-coupling factor transporter transmembrane protein EcfT n=1 Tax=Bacillus mesophilus TaxID=1808955 RepID=A0A6M0Q380_9BACI|nr:energy-coupling factor transporter transmembrane component T [Bacillus mesophilus]MBM7659984.1 energy-coupling factor transport system permease protein [Bacillus mesophilus]NEY70845.1 energy-coupling factor transporter transmembrane protein EcfT [Bacillus mesophilus]
MKETWMYKINPTVKLVGLILLFIQILTIHNINILLNLTIIVCLTFFLFNGFPLKIVALLLLPFILVFLSTSSSMILFGKGDTTWIKWGLIHITEESFFRGIHIGTRALVFAFLGLLFTLTTKPVLLFYSLMQQARLKPKYAYSFLAGYRLIPIMYEEFKVIHQALKVRGIQRKKGLSTIPSKLKAYCIPLLSQSIRRAHRIGVAMEAKKFSSNGKRTFYYQVGFSVNDLYFIALLIGFSFVSYTFGHFYPYFPIQDVRYQ